MAKITPKEEWYLLVLAIILTPIILYWIYNQFMFGETLICCSLIILFFLIWVCAIVANLEIK